MTTATAPRTDVLTQMAEHKSAEQAEALRRYRELLLRADKPRKGDAAELATVAKTLGRPTAQVTADVQLVAKAKGLAASITANAARAIQRAADARYASRIAAEEFQRVWEEQKQREAELHVELSAAQGAESIVRGQHDSLRRLVDRSGGLLSAEIIPELPKAKQEKTPGEAKAERDEQEKREKLSIANQERTDAFARKTDAQLRGAGHSRSDRACAARRRRELGISDNARREEFRHLAETLGEAEMRDLGYPEEDIEAVQRLRAKSKP